MRDDEVKEKTKNLLSSSKGLTLIEILGSIVILGIISVSFITLFIQSARTTTISEIMLDATYLAQTQMEEFYHLKNLSDKELTDLGFEKKEMDCENASCYSKESEGYYIWTEFQDSTDHSQLVRVIVKVFNNEQKEKLQAQMETLISSNHM